MAKTVRATHRLRYPHRVLFDPALHFLKKAARPKTGTSVRLLAGTHVIPSEAQLETMPDRFESLTAPEPPAEAEIEDENEDEPEISDEPEGAEDEDDEDEPETGNEDEVSSAGRAVDDALSAVAGDWEALLAGQLKALAAGYDLTVNEITGTGSRGSVLKADWILAVQGARGAE